jgi:putative FmdB family regulatory protein
MPIFEFECKSCGYEFEELKSNKEVSDIIACKKCGEQAERKLSRFSSVIAGGTSVEPIDLTIGRAANQRWQQYSDKQAERRKGKTLENVDMPKAKDGKYMPVMALGNTKDKEKRKEYSTALQEHREDRKKKGISQFSE